jgi:hypothetical protein
VAKIHQKVVGTLRRELKHFQDGLEELPGGRISGVIVSSSFAGMDHQARQDKLTSILKKHLSPQELASVGAIALLTPAEAQVKA